jgi:hypothetical protein
MQYLHFCVPLRPHHKLCTNPNRSQVSSNPSLHGHRFCRILH